jgi:enoyl-CoA hydratase
MKSARLDIDGGVGLLTLARPEARNVLDSSMVAEIQSAFDEAEARDDVSAVVVTGEGSAFCAGADLGLLAEGSRDDYLSIYEGFLRVARSPLATVAAVNGPGVGAGMNLALCCDVRVVAESARFVSRFSTLGLHPGGGHGWLVQRAAGPEIAKAMLLFGQELRGDAIVAAGLALRCVPDADVVTEAMAVARQAGLVPRPLIARMKDTLEHHIGVVDHYEAVDVEFEAQMWSREQPFFRESMDRFQKRGTRRPS